MEIIIHFVIAAILAGILFPFFSWYSLFAFIGGVLIDFDHYLAYIIKFRSLNFLKAYNYFKGKDFKKHEYTLFIFHSMELFILLIVLSYFNRIILIITIGMAVHYAADFIYEINLSGRLLKNWWTIKWINKIRKKTKD